MNESTEKTIHPRERVVIMLAYLVAIIPIFGILAALAISSLYQERSRTVVFHAKQAIAGQAIFLAVCVVIVVFKLFAFLIGLVSVSLGSILGRLNEAVLWAAFVAYIAGCCYYAWRTFEGYDMDCPIIGPRLRDRAE